VRIVERLVVSCGVALSLIFLWHAHCGANRVAAAQPQQPITVTRLYTGTDGLTHTEQVPLKLSPVAGAPATVQESEHIRATNAYVVRPAPGFFEGWHNADERRYVVTISGRAEVEVAGSQKVSVAPGNISLAEDLTGKGHTFRVVGNEDWVALFVDFAR
jgi:hypothetical protein